MENDPNQENSVSESASLEEPSTSVETQGVVTPSNQEASETPAPTSDSPPATPPKSPKHRLKKMGHLGPRINIYFIGLIFVLVVAGVIVYIAFSRSRDNANQSPSINSQALTPSQLSELQGSNPTVGSNNQNLTIQSNTTFDGNILARNNLNVAGTIKVGGSLDLPEITVSGTSNLAQVQANQLNVSGDINASGNFVGQQNLTIAGTANFSGAVSAGQLTVQGLNLSGDLVLTHHLTSTGSTPSKTSGDALGNGGTVSVSGTDTAGIITVNTGTSTTAGCFVTLNFTSAYSTTPVVVVTPVGSSSAGLAYYVNRTTTQFSVCSSDAAPNSSSFNFDYITIS